MRTLWDIADAELGEGTERGGAVNSTRRQLEELRKVTFDAGMDHALCSMQHINGEGV